ncbi:MAG: cytochrome c-type biogenesis protein CcmH [Chloroflexi bacterium]|nr:cytochrome c-type biogenesis protein CcmH [Chloroflexota bacterium]
MTTAVRRLARSDALLLLAVAVFALSLTLALASTRTGAPDDRARALDGQLRCPTCQGLSIRDSPATSAAQMRTLVREQIDAGASDEAIRAFFVARYGRWILLDPPATGVDLALFIAPAAILAAGSILVVRRAGARRPAAFGPVLGPASAGTSEVASAGQAPAPRRPARWRAPGMLPLPRLARLGIGGAMALALTVPIAAAVGPRNPSLEISGGRPQATPSIEDLTTLVGTSPRDVDALVALGDALLAADRPSEAADRYRQALAVDPNRIGALLGAGTILLASDRPEAAWSFFDRVVALSPNQADALLYRAVARFRIDGAATADVRRDAERFLLVTGPNDVRRTMAQGLLDAAVEGPIGSASPGASGSPTP